MTKKFFPIFSILLLLISLVAPGIHPVAAEENNDKTYKDGEYELPLKVLKNDSDEISAADNYLSSAKLIIENGRNTIRINVTSSTMLKELTIDGATAKTISENKSDDTRVVEVEVGNIEEKLNGTMHVVVAAEDFPPNGYDMNHKVQYDFDTSEIPEVSGEEDKSEDEEKSEENEGTDEPDKGDKPGTDGESEEPEDVDRPEEDDQSGESEETDGEKEDPEEDTKKDYSLGNLQDGYYTIGASYLRTDNDNASSMGRYLSDEIFVAVQDGKIELTVTIEEDETVTKLTVEDQESVEKLLEGDKRHETFESNELSSILSAYVEYQAPFNGEVFEGNADFRISLDEATIAEADAADKPGSDAEQEYNLDNLEDGYYTIDVSYLKFDTDDTSSMGNYLADQIFVAVQDGNVETTITIEENETVTKLEVEGKEAVEKVVEGDKRHETFKFNELSSILSGYVKYQAPYQGEVFEGAADFRISLDEATIAEANAADKPGSDTEQEYNLDNLKDGYYTIDVSYLKIDTDDTSSIGNYLADQVFVAVQDGKIETTITIEENETVTKLEIEGKEAVEKLVEGDKRHETFKSNELSSILSAYVKYQAPYQGEVFEGAADFRISLVEATIAKAEAADKPSGEIVNEEPEGSTKTVTSGEKVTVEGNDRLNIKKSKISIKMPSQLPKGTEFTIDVLSKDFSIPKEYKLAGAIVDVKVSLKEKLKDGKYTLTLPYDKNKFSADEVDIYYYDEVKELWIAQNGLVDSNAGTITLEVDDFSKYGVLSKVEEQENNKDEFDLGYTFYKPDTKEISTMDGFKKGPATIKKDDQGNYHVSMAFTGGEMIEYLKVNGKKAKVTKEDNGIKVFEFQLKSLTKKHDVETFVNVPGMYSEKHEVDLVFDDIGENSTPNPIPKPTPKPKKGKEVVDKLTKDVNGKGLGTDKKDKVDNYNFYEIDYTFYKSGTKEISIMDDFAEGSAIVREHKKNGTQYVSMTFTGADMIKSINVNGKDVNIIKENKEMKIVEFPINALNKKQSVKAFIEVPGLYATEHEVDLVFHMDTKKELQEKDVPSYLKEYIESLVVGQEYGSGDNEKDDNGEGNGKGVDDNGPDFDRDADGNLLGKNSDTEPGNNPKTADLSLSQIMLFGSLLLLSLIPLVIKLRRKFATTK